MHPKEQWTELGPEEMEIVRSLYEADFSGESGIRLSLKHRLLDRIAGPRSLWIRRTTRWQVGLAAALIVALALAASPLGGTLAQGIIQILNRWQVGENTTAVKVEGDFEALPDGSGGTIVNPIAPPQDAAESAAPLPEVENFAPMPEPEGRRHLVIDPGVSFETAQGMVRFDLQMPGFVPEGYDFVGVSVGGPGQASVEFANFDTSRLIGVLQTAVGGEDGRVQVTFSGDVVVVDTEVNGTPALWTLTGDEGLLIWEAGGVNYQLAGTSDLETAIKIAESLR